MDKLYKGPNPRAGSFTPNNLLTSSVHSSLSATPQTPVPPQSPSFIDQVDWSYWDYERCRQKHGPRVFSRSEPSRDKSFPAQLDSLSPSSGPHTWHSLPRRYARRSVYDDDPQSRGSPLKPTRHEDTKSIKDNSGHRPRRRRGGPSTGFMDLKDDFVPSHAPAFASLLGIDTGVPPDAIQLQLPRKGHEDLSMYHQLRPTFLQTPSDTHDISISNHTPIDQSPASVLPSHSLSSSQPFHKAQGSFQIENNDEIPQPSFFEPYAPVSATPAHTTPQPQVNPYAQDANGLTGSAFYQSSNSYTQQQVIGQATTALFSALTRNRSNTIFTLPSGLIESSSLTTGPLKTFSFLRTYAKVCNSKRKRL